MSGLLLFGLDVEDFPEIIAAAEEAKKTEGIDDFHLVNVDSLMKAIGAARQKVIFICCKGDADLNLLIGDTALGRGGVPSLGRQKVKSVDLVKAIESSTSGKHIIIYTLGESSQINDHEGRNIILGAAKGRSEFSQMMVDALEITSANGAGTVFGFERAERAQPD
jgi:hypothetical protein